MAATGAKAVSVHDKLRRRINQTQNQSINASTTGQFKTIQNERSNDPWGDLMSSAKPPNCTRIHIQSVNGFNLDSRDGQFDQFCAIHKEIQADISCGQEHKLDTTQMQVQSWERSKIIFGTSPIPFSSHYKPRGTFMINYRKRNRSRP
jgi:hypothetical protein